MSTRALARPPGPPYRSLGNRKFYTEALFRETNPMGEVILPVFSLYQDWVGHDGYPLINCRRTFLELKDPTGYKWAMMYLGEWSHWKHLLKLQWFQTALAGWKEELDELIKSEAIQKIAEVAAGSSQSAFQAAKFLATQDYKKGPHGRGRPTTAEVSGELKQAMLVVAAEDEDYQRMQGTLN